MKCEGCGEDAEVECADCAPKGADSEPLLLCQECCSRIHIGKGRLSKHRVVSLACKKQGLELRAKLEKCQILAGELKKRKSQVNSCKEDIDEKVKIYERQIRETTLAVCQKIKQRAITLIKKMKEAASKRAADMDGFDKHLNSTIFNKIVQIRKDLHALEKSSAEDYQEKVKAIDEQIESLDFSQLKEHLPSTCLYYSIDFAGVQQEIKTLEFELLDPPPPNPEAENVTDTPKFLTDTLEEGREMKVCIQTAVSKCGEFWLQPDFPTEVYDKLLDISHNTRQDFICNLDWKPYEPEDEELQTGILCSVLYLNDNKWYRGCIEELRSDRRSATVRYLDFGNTSMQSTSHILPYRCSVPGVPFQAIECRLAGLSEELSHEAKWTFNDMVRETLLDCKFLSKVKDESTPRSVWLVELKLTQEDNTVIDLNQMVRDRVVNKTKKESISCRDVRLFDENLPSSFKVISTTVKSGDSASHSDGAAAAVTEDGDAKGDNNEDEVAAPDTDDDKKESEDSQEPKDGQARNYSSQDVRNVGQKSQDIRNVLPRSQDVRKSTGKSQDLRKQSASQDVRSQDSQDGRHSNSGTQEPLDDCASFLSSIGIGGQSGDDSSDGGFPAGKSKGWKSRRKVGKANKAHVEHVQQAILKDIVVEHTIPQMLTVAEVEASSRIIAAPVAVGSGGQERVGTWIPSGQSYKTTHKSPIGKPPIGKPPGVFMSLNPPPASSSMETEAQAVVANIIQEVVSHFCVNGKIVDIETEVDSEVDPVSHFSEDLAYDLESRGSDEHSSGTSTITPNEQQELPSTEADSEETGVKSLLLEEEAQCSLAEVKLRSYTKSMSGSSEDINVKDSVLKPEIQDKSLSNLCGYDFEETAVKVVQDEHPAVSEVELCDPDQAQLLSMSTNEIDSSQLESLEPTCDQWVSAEGESEFSLRPDEDLAQSLNSTSMEDPGVYSRLPRIMFAPGSTFELFVVDGIQSNAAFCGQIARTVEEEAIFNRFSEELRTHGTHSNTVPLVKEGTLVLAPYDHSWYRAQIMKLNADQSVQVCFVDYGNSETMSLSSLKTLPRHLVYVPHQTSRCRLVSCYQRPSPLLTDQERVLFNRLVDVKKLKATVVILCEITTFCCHFVPVSVTLIH